MAFHDVPFPIELSAVNARSAWQSTVVELGGGNEQRAALWGDARRKYDASVSEAFTLANALLITKHHNARRGKVHSFPLRDRSSYTASVAALGTAGGIASTMQLTLDQGDGSNAYNREVYLPESGTVTIFGNAIALVETTDYTLAYSGSTGGTLTWVTNQSGKSITWTGSFYVPVRYDVDEIDSELFIFNSSGVGLVRGPSIPLIEVRYAGEF